ncbi:MAG: hypothetical protein ACPG4F_12130, partial [Paracoccaceae bacterium]
TAKVMLFQGVSTQDDAPKRRINSVKKIEKNRGSGECIQAMTGRSNWSASPDPAALILQATNRIACRSF